MLAAFLLRGDDHPGRKVTQADRALCLVYVLPTRTAGAEGVNLTLAQQVLV
jgi:hypothetical protein